MEEVISLQKSDAHRQGLIERLCLGQKRGPPKEFLAAISHPAGGTTIMEAYKIIKETVTSYLLAPPTEKERKRLDRKYGHGAGEYFDCRTRIALRE